MPRLQISSAKTAWFIRAASSETPEFSMKAQQPSKHPIKGDAPFVTDPIYNNVLWPSRFWAKWVRIFWIPMSISWGNLPTIGVTFITIIQNYHTCVLCLIPPKIGVMTHDPWTISEDHVFWQLNKFQVCKKCFHGSSVKLLGPYTFWSEIVAVISPQRLLHPPRGGWSMDVFTNLDFP